MRALSILFPLLLGGLLAASVIADNRQQRIERCIGYQEKLDELTELRRRGGSGSQMDSWRRQRNAYLDRYRNDNCKRYRRALQRRAGGS